MLRKKLHKFKPKNAPNTIPYKNYAEKKNIAQIPAKKKKNTHT